MKLILKLLSLLFLVIWIVGFSNLSSASYFDSTSEEKIYFCQWSECGIKEGVSIVKNSLDGIETEATAKDQIQKIVLYLLTFTTFVATIYIIYSWFRILTSSGDDDVIKTQKKTILYVIIWIVVMWAAWTIAKFAVSIWTGWI